VAIVRDEIGRRFGDEVVVQYSNLADEESRAQHADAVAEIEKRGLLFPVTVLDGVPLYDGAVSYPAIMRAVGNKIAEREATP
jgi:disulfide oxidoreductase YuzD